MQKVYEDSGGNSLWQGRNPVTGRPVMEVRNAEGQTVDMKSFKIFMKRMKKAGLLRNKLEFTKFVKNRPKNMGLV